MVTKNHTSSNLIIDNLNTINITHHRLRTVIYSALLLNYSFQNTNTIKGNPLE